MKNDIKTLTRENYTTQIEAESPYMIELSKLKLSKKTNSSSTLLCNSSLNS